MKIILLLTSVYPSDDLPSDNTPVVHYFTKEWASKGYNVVVIHNIVYYYRFIHFIIRFFENFIARFYKFKLPTTQYLNDRNYVLDGVQVYRIPIFKKYPKSFFTKEVLERQLKQIITLIDRKGFVPDIIIGHWVNPQLFLVKELGQLYKSKTCIVLHHDVEVINSIYGNLAKDIIKSIDVWGFRSKNIKYRFENLFGKVNSSFLCYSGIPPNKINSHSREFKNGVIKFLFVGMLIPRKFPSILVTAINNSLKNLNFHITFVGEGREEKKIRNLSKKLNIAEKISVMGRIPREEVFQLMKESDCFIMVSKHETLGLVYLEAMSAGCITVGSKNEGIDGIIEHSINGFLCNPGDTNELSILIKNISELSADKLATISKNAIKTASGLTDEKVAEYYIESVL